MERSLIFFELAFVAILLAAAASDLMYYRIPNLLVLALAVVFALAASLDFAHTAWLSHLGAALVCLAGGLLFYQFGQMGAGDVKLLSAVALWFGLNELIALLLFISLSGVAMLLLILLARFAVRRLQRTSLWKPDWVVPRVLTKKQGVPYGVAIAFGGIATMALFPPLS